MQNGVRGRLDDNASLYGSRNNDYEEEENKLLATGYVYQEGIGVVLVHDQR
jgi:hypothetical protein